MSTDLHQLTFTVHLNADEWAEMRRVANQNGVTPEGFANDVVRVELARSARVRGEITLRDERQREVRKKVGLDP